MLQSILNSFLLGNTKLAGIRTILVNTILLIIGLWEFMSKEGGLFQFLCDTSNSFQALVIFCNISETRFYVTALVVITALNNILRFITVAPVGVETPPAQMRMAYVLPNGKQQFAKAVVIGSIGAILTVIGIAIF